jgi:hypothetical protein
MTPESEKYHSRVTHHQIAKMQSPGNRQTRRCVCFVVWKFGMAVDTLCETMAGVALVSRERRLRQRDSLDQFQDPNESSGEASVEQVR